MAVPGDPDRERMGVLHHVLGRHHGLGSDTSPSRAISFRAPTFAFSCRNRRSWRLGLANRQMAARMRALMALDTGSRLSSGGDERPPTVVVAVQLPDVTDAELASSINELERLGRTLGLEIVGRVIQRRGKLAPGVVLGEGKLRELGQWTGGSGIVEAYSKPGRRKRDGGDAEVDEADEAGEVDEGDEADETDEA